MAASVSARKLKNDKLKVVFKVLPGVRYKIEIKILVVKVKMSFAT